MNLINTRESDP